MKKPIFVGMLSFCFLLGMETHLKAAVHFGDIIVTDAHALGGTGAVFAVNPQTGVQSIVSSGGYFSDPFGLAIDNNGDILVTDRTTKTILRVNPQSGAQSVISQSGWGDLVDIVVNTSGELFVLDASNPEYGRSIFQVNRTDGSKTLIRANGFSADVSLGLALDNDGQLLLGNRGTQAGWWYKDGSILRVDPITGQQTVISQYGQLGNPDDLVMSPSGDIYAVDGGLGTEHSGGVIKVNSITGQQTVITSDGFFGSCPEGIALAPDGDLFAVDFHSFDGFGAVLRIDPSTGHQSVVSNYGYFVEPVRLSRIPHYGSRTRLHRCLVTAEYCWDWLRLVEEATN